MALVSWNDKNLQLLTISEKWHGIYQGTIKDARDPQRRGRVRVHFQESGAHEDDPEGWVVANYCSPFAGATNKNLVDPGGLESDPANNQTSYGIWAVPPDEGNQVVIMFINGAPGKCVWMGCLYQDKVMRMTPGIPAGTNFEDLDNDLPVTEHFRKTSESIIENMPRAELDPGLSSGIKTQGLIRDHVRGITDSGARRETPSEVYGWLTPGPWRSLVDGTGAEPNPEEPQSRTGGHQFVMDDAVGREKIRLRTRSGAQILLDETNGLVHIINRDGTAWIHMDADGRVDVYGAQSMSVRTEQDFVVRADRDIVLEAGRNVSVKANRDWQPAESGTQHAGETAGEGGRITMHANENFDLLSAQDLRVTVNENGYLQTGKDLHTVVAGNRFSQTEDNVNVTVNQGDYNITVNGQYQHTTGGDTHIFAGDKLRAHGLIDTELFAYNGKLDIGSQSDLNVKTEKGDITVEAKSTKSNLSLRANKNRNMIQFTNELETKVFSLGPITFQTQKNIASNVHSDLDVDDNGNITLDGVPLSAGCVEFKGGVKVNFTGEEVEMSAVKDVLMRAEEGISNINNAAGTSLTKINERLDNLQQAVNQLSITTWEYVTNILDAWGSLSINIPFPQIPPLPLPLPSIQFPALNLPEFDFDFCLDFNNLIDIGQFNPLPDGLFVGTGLDLNGWSKRNIKSWANRQRDNFTSMVAGLRIDKQITAALDTQISNFRRDLRSVRDSLRNLTTVSITVRDKDQYLGDYTRSVTSLLGSLTEYRNSVAQVPSLSAVTVAEKTGTGSADLEVLDQLDIMISELAAHSDNMQNINIAASENPGVLEDSDFSDLAEQAQLFAELDSELESLDLPEPDELPVIVPDPGDAEISASHTPGTCIVPVGSSCTASGVLTAAVVNSTGLVPPYVYRWSRVSGAQLSGTDTIELPPTAQTAVSTQTQLSVTAQTTGDNLVATTYKATVTDSSTPPNTIILELPEVEYNAFGADAVVQATTNHQAGVCDVSVGSSCTASGLLLGSILSTENLTAPYSFVWNRVSGAQLNGTDTITVSNTSLASVQVPTALTETAQDPGANVYPSRYDLTITDSSPDPVVLTVAGPVRNYVINGI